jgi:hypothetical protein
MPKYSHAYDFAFEVESDDEEGDDVTAAMLIAACRARLERIEAANDGAEMLEACDCFDTVLLEPTPSAMFSVSE